MVAGSCEQDNETPGPKISLSELLKKDSVPYSWLVEAFIPFNFKAL
jgi:hypothetical protein